MKKILVTGADGFIGSHLVEALVRRGFDVRAFVIYNSFSSRGWLDYADQDIIKNIEIFQGDIRDPNGVKVAMRGCSHVMHLAALIGIPYSYHSPDTYVDTNIKGTLNLLQAAREIGVDRFIHTSTSEVYGTALTVPINESHPVKGQSPYSATKIAADHLSQSFFTSFDLPVVILRPFNTFGPRQSARAVIPTIISQIASGNKTLELGSIVPTRDFSYVSDTVLGFLSALSAESVEGEVFNLGSNFEISVGDTAKLISNLMGSDAQIIEDENRLRPTNSEVERLWSDNTKARRCLGWVPEFSGLSGFERGLTKTIEWFVDRENLSHYKPNIYNV